MGVIHSAELQQVLAQARDIAAECGQPLSSAHVLLAVFTVPNLGELVLLDRQIDEEALLAQIERMEREPDDTIRELEVRATALARGCDHTQVNCLHLLAAITRLPRSFAYRLLERAGVSIPQLRTTALRCATNGVPQRLLKMSRALDEEMDTAAMPALRDDDDVVSEVAGPGERRDGGRGRETGVEPALSTATAEQPRPLAQRGPDRRATGGRRASDRRPAPPVVVAAPTVAPRTVSAPPRAPEDMPSPYVLNRDRFRWVNQLGRNLSHLAYLGRIDPVIGRDREILECIDILHKRRSNNPCLVGEPGVGKTAIAEGVALRLVEEHKQRGGSPERVIVQIDVGAIIAGTHLRGSLAERLRGLQDEVRAADGAIIVFIDEIHTLVGAGGGDGAHDAAQELKSALARGQFPCIGATTPDEYRRHIEQDAALERRFTAVHVDEPDVASTLGILRGVVDRYAAHHGVAYEGDALESAVRLGRRYLHDRRDPDKSLGILDLAGAVARRGGTRVDKRAVAEVIARIARVPVEHLLIDDPQRFLEMEARLGERVVGQRHALRAMSETIRRNFAGFAGGRPIGSFLLLGPTGVGKTEAARALAQFLFGSRDALVRFDMSEYLEAHSVARLIGAPPGYVGHQEGGQLTEAVRRKPYQIVLLDEIEKSHREVWNVLLQVLDEGRLTDGRGRTVDFSNTVIILTSNLGSDVFDAAGAGRRIGFAGGRADDGAEVEGRALAKARAAFPPELWNRIESRLVFHALGEDEVRQIARLLLRDRARLLMNERQIDFEVDDAGIDVLLARGGFDARLGARPMRQTIAREVEGPLAQRILRGDVKPGDRVVIRGVDGALAFG